MQTNTFQITQELLVLIAEIAEFKGEWRALGTLAPERLKALRHMATVESIGSSTRIEGRKLTDHEIETLLKNLEIKRLNSCDEQEVIGYAKVMETIFQSWRNISITENYIKQLHRDLLSYSNKDKRHRGKYKILRNDVAAFKSKGKRGGIVFETATPSDIPDRMQELIKWFNKTSELKELHPLIAIAIFKVTFLAIHPFQDGNWRLSHVLTTLLLLQKGYVYVPYSSLERIIENNKESYYLALKQTQKTIYTSTPNWEPWILFFLRALQEQKRQLEIKIESEKKALFSLSELALNILDYVHNHGRVTTRNMVREIGASPNTLKVTFTSLVEKGLLMRHGKGRAIWYSLP
ncbi:Fic family protein [Bartonella rattimassiliensis]|uniref:Fido domain-containing protein n=1 Tax=Bartonella rattimassiliensis 15908 TaxID=1094556 RepID=J1JEM0_9HYPH|nr:Fic family protein [Bartonella rattimassiliensis]EJF82525.1 hypothetical protein MCY_01734 [Bartonella rattimassiliensis 15908]